MKRSDLASGLPYQGANTAADFARQTIEAQRAVRIGGLGTLDWEAFPPSDPSTRSDHVFILVLTAAMAKEATRHNSAATESLAYRKRSIDREAINAVAALQRDVRRLAIALGQPVEVHRPQTAYERQNVHNPSDTLLVTVQPQP